MRDAPGATQGATQGGRAYTLLGRDGQPYAAAAPGSLGGNRRLKIYGRLDCPAAKRALARPNARYAAQRVFFCRRRDGAGGGLPPVRRLHARRLPRMEGSKGRVSMVRSYDYATRRGVEEISWDGFAALARRLAELLAGEGVEAVVGLARAGLFPATAVACALRCELYPARLTRRVDDVVVCARPEWVVDVAAGVAGKVVAVVDEIADSGETLALAAERARAQGAARVVTAALVSHSWAAPAPDVAAQISDALVIFPWDREVYAGGAWGLHPEIAAALAQQEPPHTIKFYRRNEPYFELTNHYPAPFEVDGTVWPTVEHYYQANKAGVAAWRDYVRAAATAGEAKRRGRQTPDFDAGWWNSVRDSVMWRALCAKFTQHADLRALLLGTGDAVLVENSPTDSYWGQYNGVGENRLGRMLMELRARLAAQPEQPA